MENQDHIHADQTLKSTEIRNVGSGYVDCWPSDVSRYTGWCSKTRVGMCALEYSRRARVIGVVGARLSASAVHVVTATYHHVNNILLCSSFYYDHSFIRLFSNNFIQNKISRNWVHALRQLSY